MGASILPPSCSAYNSLRGKGAAKLSGLDAVLYALDFVGRAIFNPSGMGDPQELQLLQEEVRELRARLGAVEQRIEALKNPPAVPPVIVVAPVAMPATAPVAVRPPEPAVPPVIAPPPPIPRESFEVRLGTYWLPRIGIAVLLTGMVFLVTWSYQYLGRGGKVALSYLCCALLGGLGVWLERKTPAFGRVLLAGALALTYFVTYALHFVPAFHVVESATVALSLLVVVVAGIVIVADRKQSALIAGMALFFGYYTSLVSGVDTFTLAANALLAAAAWFLLARNRWVPLSFLAALATYLVYAIWAWKVSDWRALERLLFDTGYLSDAQFRLRAGFLGLYWVMFAAGGLVVSREALPLTERKGLVTLNNAFFFVLFALLMQHAYPGQLWAFYFLFAGVLFVMSALSYRRFAPDRGLLDVLFWQALAVATLGVIRYFEGGTLAAALALESLLIVLLARWMASPGLLWLARAVYAVAVGVAWARYPGVWTAWGAAVIGFGCARLAGSRWDGLYFGVAATLLAMRVAEMYFDPGDMPWVWTLGAVVVAGIAALLRVPGIGWAAHLPLVWAHLSFYWARGGAEEWALAPVLALIAVTFGFGLGMWGYRRATVEPERARIAANRILRPYAILAFLAVAVATRDFTPERWQLAVYAGEALVFVVAGVLAAETLFIGLAMATMATGAIIYSQSNPADVARNLAWVNLLAGVALLVISERLFRWRQASLLFFETTVRRLGAWMVVIITAIALFGLRELTSPALLTVVWAVGGFMLLVLGFLGKERAYRFAGLFVLTLSLSRAIFYDLGKLETIYRILTYMGLGAILLILGYLYTKNRERLTKWL